MKKHFHYIPIIELNSPKLICASEKKSSLDIDNEICRIPRKFLEDLGKEEIKGLSARVLVAENPGSKTTEYVTLLSGSKEVGLYKNVIYKGEHCEHSVETYASKQSLISQVAYYMKELASSKQL